MGFNGGGGSGQITAHVHDNNAGQGGALSDLTLANATLLTGTFRRMQVLDAYVASIAESSHEFDFSADPLNLETQFSKIVVVFGGQTTALCDLQHRVNQLATLYFDEDVIYDSGVVSGTARTSQAQGTILTSVVMDSARDFLGTLQYIWSALADDFQYISNAGGTGEGGSQVSGIHSGGAGGESITHIRLNVSAGNWGIGTHITVYGVLREDASD